MASEGRLCVRNYLQPDAPLDPCGEGLDRYAYVIDRQEPEKKVCTLTYEDRHCKFSSKEFDHALTPDNTTVVCVINFHQPPLAAQCAESPDLYDWVSAAYRP